MITGSSLLAFLVLIFFAITAFKDFESKNGWLVFRGVCALFIAALLILGRGQGL